MSELYEKKYVDNISDLPRANGTYVVMLKGSDKVITVPYVYGGKNIWDVPEYFVSRIEWYFKPIGGITIGESPEEIFNRHNYYFSRKNMALIVLLMEEYAAQFQSK